MLKGFGDTGTTHLLWCEIVTRLQWDGNKNKHKIMDK